MTFNDGRGSSSEEKRFSGRLAAEEPLILGIETSCDETGIGIVRGHTLLADAVASSVDAHARYGGVVPEVASRAHLEAMVPTMQRALDTAGVTQAVADFLSRFSAAEKSGSADSILAMYTPDARLDVQGMPAIDGRAALDAVIRPMAASRTITDMKLMPNETAVVSNELVLQGGTFAETYVEKKKTSVAPSRPPTNTSGLLRLIPCLTMSLSGA